MYKKTEVEVVDKVEQFLTDDEPQVIGETETRVGMNARMFGPKDAVNLLQRRYNDRYDILVNDARKLNIQSLGNGNFAIAPDVGEFQGELSKSIKRQKGLIPISTFAFNQICSRMGISGAWKHHYSKMNRPDERFIVDFNGWYGRDKDPGKRIIFRTQTKRGVERSVVGVISENEPRTDMNAMVRIAMAEIMKRVGSTVKGIEFVDDPEICTTSFRIVFGFAGYDRSEHIIRDNGIIHPMLNLTLSESGWVAPSANLGMWRQICRNTAMNSLCNFAKFKGSGCFTIVDFRKQMSFLADITIPFGDFVAQRLDPLYTTKVKDPFGCIDTMIENGSIGQRLGEQAIRYLESDVIERGVKTEFDLFNLLSDAAKVLTPVTTRVNAESRIMDIALMGGFNHACGSGFHKRIASTKMLELIDAHPELKKIRDSVLAKPNPRQEIISSN